MDWKIFLNQDPRLSGMVQRASGRPAWPTLAAVVCGVLVVVVPVVLALLAGLVVGVVVYAIGSAIARVGEFFSGLAGRGGDSQGSARMPGDDMRENVRVVQRH